MEQEEISGILKLRIPKSIHRELIDVAKEEGISVNQYCVSMLVKDLAVRDMSFFGYKKADAELLHIRNIAETEEDLFARVYDFSHYIDSLKPLLFRKIESVMKYRGIPENDMVDLEQKFPVMSGRSYHDRLPWIKVPSFKMVISWDIDTKVATTIINRYTSKFQENIHTQFMEGYIDQLERFGHIYKYTENDIPVYSVTIWGDDFMQVKQSVLKLKSQLKDVSTNIKEVTDIFNAYDKLREKLCDSPVDRSRLDKIEIRIEPIFIVKPISEEFEKYRSR